MKRKERILIFRTAKMHVVDLLMEQLNKESEITFLVQTNVADEIRDKYPFAEVISIQDTYFNYASFCRNVTLDKKFDSVYVLTSMAFFWGYEEVFLIVDQIRYRKLILFNGKGEKQVERRNCFSVIVDNLYSIFAQIYMKIIAIWYENWGKKYKF